MSLRRLTTVDDLLLRREEAAKTLRIGLTKLNEMIQRHELPVIRIGRATRIPASGVRAWVERQLIDAER